MILAWKWYQAHAGAGTAAEVRAWRWARAWQLKVRRILAESIQRGKNAPPPWAN